MIPWTSSSPRKRYSRQPIRFRRKRRSWLPYRMIRDAVSVATVFAVMVGVGLAREQGWFDRLERLVPTPSQTTGPRSAARRIPLCSGSVRVTCVVDGDTGWEAGTKWRMTGIDAPEVSKPGCAAEKSIGNRATHRLQALMSGGYSLHGGGLDRYGRRLVSVTLANGRDAGEVLMAEGLAQRWPNSGNKWCG